MITRRSTGIAAELAVLAVLEPGGLLTVRQLAEQAGLTGWAARAAVAWLERRALVAPAHRRSRWRITDLGRTAAASRVLPR
ncbi:hypothetical protein [Nocardia thraciensis]